MVNLMEEGKNVLFGRGERIRTSDILLPKQARYQAALRPDSIFSAWPKTAKFSARHYLIQPQKYHFGIVKARNFISGLLFFSKIKINAFCNKQRIFIKNIFYFIKVLRQC